MTVVDVTVVDRVDLLIDSFDLLTDPFHLFCLSFSLSLSLI